MFEFIMETNMKEGINTVQMTPTSESLTQKEVVAKAIVAANQQAFRGRPINEITLQRHAKQFGKFAKNYCEAYRAEHTRVVPKNPDVQVINQAHHCARRQFNYKSKDNIHNHPKLEKISKFAQKYGDRSNLFTVCYLQHYNKLLVDSGKQIPESLIMPPYKRGVSNNSSQVTTQDVIAPAAVIEGPIDLRNSLTDSKEELLIKVLSDLKNPNDFIPDMIITVPPQPSVIFSSTTTVNHDKMQCDSNYDISSNKMTPI